MTTISVASAGPLLAMGFSADIAWIPTLLLAGVCAVLVFAAGIAVARAFAGRPSAPGGPPPQPAQPPPPSPMAPAPGPDPAALRALAEQRDALIAGSVKVRGLLDDQLLTDELDNALRRGGVTVFDPTGAPMDRSRFRVSRTVPAPDPSADGVVAQTLAPGYLDNGRLLRPAEVVVYSWGHS